MHCEQEVAAQGRSPSEWTASIRWMNPLVLCQTNLLSDLILVIGEAEMNCCPYLIPAC